MSCSIFTVLGLLVTSLVIQACAAQVEQSELSVVLSSYLGGSEVDDCDAISVDSAGNIYLACHSNSVDFPTPEHGGNIQPGHECCDAFVVKLSGDGSSVLYATHLGGELWEAGLGIAVDAVGNVYVVGLTHSPDFPTTMAAFQPHLGGEGDAFVAKLDPSGAVVYSTYFGGAEMDVGLGIAVDDAANVYITGWTTSSDFPTTTGVLQTVLGGTRDVFVAKLDASGTVTYSTYLGGSGEDGDQRNTMGIAVDDGENVTVAGSTESVDFPLERPFQARKNNGADAFIAKLNSTATALEYSTYLGGSGQDSVHDLAVDDFRNVYVVGTTDSTDLPTTRSATQDKYGGDGDAFLARLSTSGSDLLFATYLGGAEADWANRVAVSQSGNVYVAGGTESVDFPSGSGPAQEFSGTAAFVAALNLTDANSFHAIRMGGSGARSGFGGLAAHVDGSVYVSGLTDSTDFPTKNALQPSFGGGFADTVVVKLD